jgi:hypothetical protein
LNVYRVSDVRQIEIHTTEPLIPGPTPFQVEIAIAKLRKYKSPGSDQIPAEMIQAGGLRFINSIWNKKELPDQWKESVMVPIHKKGDKTDCSNYHGISLPSTSYTVLSDILSRLSSCID